MIIVLNILFYIIMAFAFVCMLCSIKLYLLNLSTKHEDQRERRISAVLTFMFGANLAIIAMFIHIVAR